MPLRVRCRCGQELTLRYSEWVYFLLGLALVAVLLNTAAVVALYLRMERLDAEKASEREASRPPDREAFSPKKDAGGPPGVPVASENRRAAREPRKRGRPVPESRGTPRPPDRKEDERLPAGDTQTTALPGAAESAARALGAEAPREDLLRQLAALSGTESRPEDSRLRLQGDEATQAVPLVDAPLIVRLLLWARFRNRAETAAGFLLDPDARLRSLALEHLEASLGRTAGIPGDLRALARRAAPLFGANGRAADFFSRFEEGREAPSFEAGWARLQDTIEKALQSDPALQSLAAWARETEARGLDLVLAVDVTRSMEEALGEVQEALRAFLPAAAWALPNFRTGCVLYRDEVVASAALESDPLQTVLPVLLAARPEGGGSPAEGLYPALRAALEIGRMGWRSDSRKHIVFVGDGTLARSEKRAFESLAEAAHREGEVRVHLFGIRPQEGRPEVPFFADLARAGGGRTATVTRETLPQALLASLLGTAAEAVAAEAAAVLEEVSGGAE